MRKNKLYLLFLLLFFCLFQETYAGDKKPPTVWGTTGENKTNAYNDKWYQETASSLTISSDKDLGSLIKALKEDKTFKDKTIELAKDLDMSAYLWATVEKPFKGVFNGNGHTIKGLKSGDGSSPWAFIALVDSGEINKVSINGSFIGGVNVGGIVGVLHDGKVTNCAYTGTLSTLADTTRIGGIVAVNQGGDIANCYFSGAMSLMEGNVAGNIAGVSTGVVSDSYFLVNDQETLGVGEDGGTTTEVKEQTPEAFASGEVSWLLNQSNGTHSGVWSLKDTLPVFAVDTLCKAIYKITYVEGEKGTVSGPAYVIADSIVNLTPKPMPGYLCSKFLVTGAALEVNDHSFTMPVADLQISAEFTDFEGPSVKEATDITSSGFTAHWEAVDGAIDYLLTVKTIAGEVLESYDAISLGDTTSYNITNLLPDTEYEYYIQTRNVESVSKMSQKASVRTVKGSTVTYSPKVVEFRIGKEAIESQTIAVNGNYLTEEINVTLNVSENFSVSANTLPKEGGDLIITYHSSAPGSYKDTLTLSTAGAQTVKVPLKGLSELIAPKPTAASVEKYSFVAKWDAVPFAEKYLLSLTQNGVAVEGYDSIDTTGHTYEFTKLKVNTKYSLVVSSVLGEDTLIAQVLNVTTTGDYGKQLNNSGFEYWEGTGDDAEPVDWNSFMTQNDGFSMAYIARKKHMEQSVQVRPSSPGVSSTRIWTMNVGAKANGNLTCGRINAGSMTPTDYANHNYTVVGDPNFSESLNGAKPDSISVWVRFNPINVNDTARMSAIIHDTYKYQEPTNNPEILKHKVADAIYDILATEDKGWQRLSIPFNYRGPSTSADYMLVTFASNKKPGGGNENDEVYIDDILLIYNPKVAITKIDKSAYKQGGTISVDYKIEGTMSPSNLNAEPNVVTLQMSDAEGSFDNPTVLTSVTTDYSGTLTAVIPEECPLGTKYRVRVITTNYPMVSESNADDIEIFEPGASKISTTKPNDFVAVTGSLNQQTISVEGVYLSKEIKVTLDKSDQGFSVDHATLPTQGGEVKITYAPTVVGENIAVITLSSEELEQAVTVNLKGLARPIAPELGEVTHATPVGFTLNWSEVQGATDYELTITPVGGEAVTVSTGVVTSYTLVNLAAATEYEYSLVAKVGEIASLPVVGEGTVSTLPKPEMSVEQASLEFDTAVIGTNSESKALVINTSNLFGDIKAEIVGSNFTVTPAVLSKDSEEKNVQVVFAPTSVNETLKATLKLSTEYGDSVKVSLLGSSLPKATKALEAKDVSSESFLANWEAVEDATYRLTVKRGEEILSGYDAAPIRRGNSVTVKGLLPETNYSYSVQVVLNSQVSASSNEVEVSTTASGMEGIGVVEVSVYPNPVRSDLYIKGEVDKVDVFTVDGMFIATYRVVEGKVNVNSLNAGVYIFVVSDPQGYVTKVRVVKE